MFYLHNIRHAGRLKRIFSTCIEFSLCAGRPYGSTLCCKRCFVIRAVDHDTVVEREAEAASQVSREPHLLLSLFDGAVLFHYTHLRTMDDDVRLRRIPGLLVRESYAGESRERVFY